MVGGARGAADEGLVTQDPSSLEGDDGLEDGGQLVLQKHRLEAAAVLELVLHPLDAHALPGLLDEPRDEPLSHDEGVEEDEGEADGDLGTTRQVGRRETRKAPVQVVGDAAGRRLEVGDLEVGLVSLRREEHEEGVATPLVHREDVAAADLGPLQLQDEVLGHPHDLLEGPGAVVALHLGEPGDVHEQQRQAPVLHQDVAKLGNALPVRGRLRDITRARP